MSSYNKNMQKLHKYLQEVASGKKQVSMAELKATTKKLSNSKKKHFYLKKINNPKNSDIPLPF